MDSAYLDEKYKLLEQQEEIHTESVGDDSSSPSRSVQNWVIDQQKQQLHCEDKDVQVNNHNETQYANLPDKNSAHLTVCTSQFDFSSAHQASSKPVKSIQQTSQNMNTVSKSDIPNSNANLQLTRSPTQPNRYNNTQHLTSTTMPFIDSTFGLNVNNIQNFNNQSNPRQSIPRELPIFSGIPEDWPLFWSTFEWSTSTCGFSNEENLIRLQKAFNSI